MMKPCTDVVQRVKLRVICKNYATTTEPTLFTHDWTPVAKKPFKVSSTGTVPTKNIARDSFLWEGVRNKV
jgi:hypothetical protein